MCLLIILMYIFAIALTQMAADTEMGEEHFPGVLSSMYSLWVYGTLLDGVSAICNEMKEESLICLFIFNVFIVLSAFTLMNMLIGVTCEVVSTVAAAEKEGIDLSYVRSQLQDILMSIDENSDG